MDVFLAGLITTMPESYGAFKDFEVSGCRVKYPQISALESFYYLRSEKTIKRVMECGKLLVDSGCFTFMSDNKKAGRINLDEYTDSYIRFINDYGIDLFVEMDVDSVCGLKEAERLRAKLERGTGKQPIPVWHVSRGKDYYLGMVKDYPYVAFGGLLTDGVSKTKLEAAFPWFIDKAHENGAKIHGLGYTSVEGMKKYHFDSVDSTAWLVGNACGFVQVFDPNTCTFKRVMAPQGKKILARQTRIHNAREWLKFQQYARKHL